MDAMGRVRREFTKGGRSADDFTSFVRSNLYPDDYQASGGYPDSLLTNLTLIAVGALVMPSSRGSIADVITLNFDDLLESYLEVHGFTSQPVPDLPALLRADVDVTVFHPHGFIPLEATRVPTRWTVLTRQEFVQRIATTSGHAWPRFLTNLFSTKQLLAIGTSMSDVDLHVHLEQANAERGDGPAGFVVNDIVPPTRPMSCARRCAWCR
jgi:hypothetical protein